MALPFHSSEPTVGMELELMLVDADTLELVDAVLGVLEGFPGESHVKPELLQCAVEIISEPCKSVRELRREMTERVLLVARRCEELGLSLAGGGCHPFSSRVFAITPTERYRALSAHGGFLMRRFHATCAVHVHVGMPSAEDCLRVLADARLLLAPLLTLSSSSALWEGEDTGFASFRHRLLQTARNYGPPPPIETPYDLERVFVAGSRSGAMTGWRDVHWDARPRPDYGTLELRICDAPATLSSALALAAFIHALVVSLLEGGPVREWLPGPLPEWLEKENAFRASRHGLEASFIVDRDGRVMAARELLTGVLTGVAPTAFSLGYDDELHEVVSLIAHGPWSERQRELIRDLGSAHEVMRRQVSAFARDLAANARGRRSGGAALLRGHA